MSGTGGGSATSPGSQPLKINLVLSQDDPIRVTAQAANAGSVDRPRRLKAKNREGIRPFLRARPSGSSTSWHTP